jgi:hypothetical protein
MQDADYLKKVALNVKLVVVHVANVNEVVF